LSFLIFYILLSKITSDLYIIDFSFPPLYVHASARMVSPGVWHHFTILNIFIYIYIHNYNILCIIKVFEYWQARETGYLTHISNKCVRQQKDIASWHQVQLCFHSQSCALTWTKDKISECSLLSPFALLAFFAFPVIRTCALRYECVAPRAEC